MNRARHFLLDPPNAGPGDPCDFRVAEVVDPVRKEYCARKPGQHQDRRFKPGEPFGVDRLVVARIS
jgi:hypothetical protein